MFFLCRHCDRGDRYCSRRCREEARRTTLRGAGQRYQRSRQGRLHHAARQARYRARQQKVTHQTSHIAPGSGIVPTPLATNTTTVSGREESRDADGPRPLARPRCARCGRPGRFVRHTTLAHVRPRPTPRR